MYAMPFIPCEYSAIHCEIVIIFLYSEHSQKLIPHKNVILYGTSYENSSWSLHSQFCTCVAVSDDCNNHASAGTL